MSGNLLSTLHQAHRELFDRLLDATEGLGESAWATPTGCPGWDVHDQLAHCVGLERRLLGDPGPQVRLPELPHITDELSQVMEQDVEARRGVPGDQLREEARETFSRRLRMLSELGPEALTEPLEGPGGLRGKGSTMLRLRVFDLCAHEQDIRRALGRDRDPDGAHGQLVLEQILRGLAHLWPQRLAGPGAIEVELTGPQPASRRIELPTAEGVDRVTRLRFAPAALVAVAGGRSDAPGTAALHVDGDAALAAEALATAAMTP